MRPRLPLRRILFVRPLRPPNTPRPFTQNSLVSRSRPQVPFLSQSSAKIRPVARFLTTETKRWIKDEVRKGAKYTAVAYTGTFLLLLIAFGVQQEYLDRKFPSPHEWSWILRKNYRSAKYSDRFQGTDDGTVDWARTGHWYVLLLERLEDPALDGAGLQEQNEGGILVEGVGRTGFDITEKTEPWRRGYYDVLMGAARAAEYLDGWVEDRTRKISFPANVVIGPSNPNPRPVPPGAAAAPREEDCDIAYDPPEKYYMKILTTRGFTEKQRLDAALAYGTWLDYKGAPEAALETYKWAIDIATLNQPENNIDRATGILNVNAGPPSSNLLSAATALAVHHALHSNIAAALPIFLSVLRARRCLPDPPATMRSTLVQDGDDTDRGFWTNLLSLVKRAFTPPKYPPPPDDGTTPPQRDAKERCEEAGIMTYIGEILYASNQNKNGQEDGLAWTREAVDIAEEILRGKGLDKDGKSRCKDCLQVGLTNWATMVSRLARNEKSQTKGLTSSGWLGLRGNDRKEVVGRWESENHVVQERMRRVKELLDNSKTTGARKNSSMLFM